MSPKLTVVVGVIFFNRKERDIDRGRKQVKMGTGWVKRPGLRVTWRPGPHRYLSFRL